MKDLGQADTQILRVKHFQDLVSTPFQGENNAICWTREISGDFEEIVNKVELDENITVVSEEDLLELTLSQQGQLAREILLNDLRLLTAHGAAPVLNVIKNYDRDDDFPFFPTDVYSYHVDCSPIPGDTILCTYYGEPSEILPNSEVTQKILIPEICSELSSRILIFSISTPCKQYIPLMNAIFTAQKLVWFLIQYKCMLTIFRAWSLMSAR
jgi:hypothetical protein